ncbi:MAG: hypothetical protein IJK41_01035 [Muribaculaceae bacterium]|nr:hypothetical protein [Muribaculaceae bacterium]
MGKVNGSYILINSSYLGYTGFENIDCRSLDKRHSVIKLDAFNSKFALGGFDIDAHFTGDISGIGRLDGITRKREHRCARTAQGDSLLDISGIKGTGGQDDGISINSGIESVSHTVTTHEGRRIPVVVKGSSNSLTRFGISHQGGQENDSQHQ